MRYGKFSLFVVMVLVVSTGAAVAAEISLKQVTFPERNQVEIAFTRDARAPAATLTAEVQYREGQAKIDLKFREMKPAVLFGGDVTCYVLWAAALDGTVENLGELWVRDDSETLLYSTGLKAFAMMVTAESHPLVSKPSDLVMFISRSSPEKKAVTETFTFSDFAPTPEIEYPSVAKVIWDRDQNLDLRQAETAYELAVKAGAAEYSASLTTRAGTTLAQARSFAAQNKTKKAIDYSRRTATLAAQAMQMTAQQKEAEALAAEIERRQAETTALEDRAKAAEDSEIAAKLSLAEANQSIAEANLAIERAESQRIAAAAAVLGAQQELTRIETEKAELQSTVEALDTQARTLEEKARTLEEQARALQEEKAKLSARLAGALSQVSGTRSSARGTIVNLPDILFDTNEATLKTEARIVLAKLAGILLIMSELNLRIEGHTDSTGSADHNQRLSERRAMSVRDFVALQGIAAQRSVAVGYGFDRPVAENTTREGRAKNRRVDIVIAEGVIAEEAAPTP
jgi:outer membrane protein OmpA-like peptidoglycan-associated protein